MLLGLCHAFLLEKCLGAVRDWVSRGCPYFGGNSDSKNLIISVTR